MFNVAFGGSSLLPGPVARFTGDGLDAGERESERQTENVSKHCSSFDGDLKGLIESGNQE